MALITLCIISAVALLLLRFLFSTARNFRNSRRAQRTGCRPVRSPDRNDPFGWKAFGALRKARADHVLPIQLGLDMDQVGDNPHTVQRRFLWNKLIMTRDPENIKTILATQVSHWELSEARRGILATYVGTGLLTNEGQAWKLSRSRVRPQFSQVSVSNLALYKRHAQDLFLKLAPDTDGWTGNINLQPLFFKLTLDAATEFFYGQSVHSQNPAAQTALGGHGKARPPNGEEFNACVDAAADWVSHMSILGKWYKFAPARQFKRSRAKIYGMVDWYVQEALGRVATKSSTEPSESSRFVLLDELVKFTHDKIWLRNETLGLLTGGRSTSAALLSWLFYYLARQPSLYHKLRVSIMDEFGTVSEAGQITVPKLRACHYLQSCINEALRLGSPTPTTARAATRNTTLPRGGGPEGKDPIYIPKGTEVSLNFFNLHHREDIWGKDVNEFKPERWERFDRGWEYIPFGGGPRACIGRDFALNEVSYVVVHLVQRCDDIQLMNDTERVRYDTTVINKTGGGVHVRLHHKESI
ncbi:MAG: hypothetical protein Q9184_000823 [Pyrenodesmia sp. 2 TL-2023]